MIARRTRPDIRHDPRGRSIIPRDRYRRNRYFAFFPYNPEVRNNKDDRQQRQSLPSRSVLTTVGHNDRRYRTDATPRLSGHVKRERPTGPLGGWRFPKAVGACSASTPMPDRIGVRPFASIRVVDLVSMAATTLPAGRRFVLDG